MDFQKDYDNKKKYNEFKRRVKHKKEYNDFWLNTPKNIDWNLGYIKSREAWETFENTMKTPQ